jgi:hypothetical protein
VPVKGQAVPARIDQQDDRESAEPSSTEQSGSAGRVTGSGENEQGQDTGQDRYGQSGFGGEPGQQTLDQANYRRSAESQPRKKP